MEDVFKALADESRRELLDRLFERDGQTLTELCEGLGMTRFGVMKHLGVLENAGLVSTRRAGREKFHYLNPVPIRLLHDRWISRFTAPWVGALADLKFVLEEDPMAEKPRHVYETYIRTTPEALWRALTTASETRKYYYGTAVESDWKAGSAYSYRGDGGEAMIDGAVIEVDPPKRLVTTARFLFDPEAAKEPESRVIFEIEPMGEVCKLTLVHENIDQSPVTAASTAGGWPLILAGLKTLLETGEPLPVGA